MPLRDHHSQLSRARASFFCGIVATLLVCSLCTVILSGHLQVGDHDRLHEKHRDYTAPIYRHAGRYRYTCSSRYAEPAFVLQISVATRNLADVCSQAEVASRCMRPKQILVDTYFEEG